MPLAISIAIFKRHLKLGILDESFRILSNGVLGAKVASYNVTKKHSTFLQWRREEVKVSKT